MRWHISLVSAAGGSVEQLVVEADPDQTAGDVAASVRGSIPGVDGLWLDGAPFDGAALLGDGALTDGAILTAVPAGGPPAPAGRVPWPGVPGAVPGRRGTRPGTWELAVVSGPHAGAAVALQDGQTVLVGRDAQAGATLVLPDDSVSRVHARIGPDPVTGRGWSIDDLDSTNGTWLGLDCVPPGTGGVELPVGVPIHIGASVLELRPPLPADADVHPDGGTVAFNRPARIDAPFVPPSVDLPARPKEPDKTPMPWIQALAPLVLGLALYLVTRTVTMLFFCLLSPVMFVTGSLGNNRRQKQKYQRDLAAYDVKLGAARAAVQDAAAAEQAEVRRRQPDPVAVAEVAGGPNRRLWERRDSDDDFLRIRLGLIRREAIVALMGGAGRADSDDSSDLRVPELAAAPITVDLPTHGVLGIAGPTGPARRVTRWILAQLATWHNPASLQIQVLSTQPGSEEWDFVRWFPHARSDAAGDPVAFVGGDRATCEERVRDLLKLLDSRAEPDHSFGAVLQERTFSPAVVMVLDGARALRTIAGVPRLLQDGPRHGIYIVAIDGDATRLPQESQAELVIDAGGAVASMRAAGRDPAAGILLDQVSGTWAEAVARDLAPLRDAGGEQAAVTLPTSVRLLDLLDIDGIDVDDPSTLAAAWHRRGRSTRAPVGASIDGTFTLDVKADGPHALVAGTTGSGKSEFLQTLVASLAVANRPEAMQFVLVDYKGASAFADCAELPHTVGMVTNLDGRETQRALASLDAELHRREVVLSAMRAVDVDAAWAADPAAAASSGLARLVLVIDEFAELVQELPDFVSGLIRIARVGRSLGVHLILATQRPAGVVTGEIKANTGLRVALRMEDPADSAEVLEAPDAARIARSTPGRGYARMGGGAALVAFQSARVAGRRRGDAVGLPPPQVVRVGWSRLGYPLVPRPVDAAESKAETDLRALVCCAREAARLCGVAPQASPWLPPLPSVVTQGELPAAGGGGGFAGAAGGDELAGAGVVAGSGSGPTVPAAWGLEDRPTTQSQVAASFDPAHSGHLVVAGSPRSGRSTLLRTLAVAAAMANGPDDLHLFAFDFGNGALSALEAFPHCGAVVRRAEGERMERLMARLVAELDRRQELLAATGFGDVDAQRAAAPAAERLAYQLVLLDRWEGTSAGFAHDAADPFTDGVARLIREGLAAGFRVVLAGDRTLLTDRTASQIEERLVLRLSDRDDYRLAGINPRQLPPDPAPGRAFRAESGIEIQVALLGGSCPGAGTVAGGAGVGGPGVDASAQGQSDAARALAAEAHRRWGTPTHRPIRVEIMPRSVRIDTLVERLASAGGAAVPVPQSAGGRYWVPLGVGGDEGDIMALDLGALGGFVVAGPPRSGRSTALAAIAGWYASQSLPAVVVALRESPLSQAAARRGIPVLNDTSASTGEKLVEAFNESASPVVVFVDDAESFARSPADEAIRSYSRDAGPGRMIPIVSGTVDDLRAEMRGVVGDARRAQAGILLSPGSPFDGDLLGAKLARSFLERMPPGRGVLILDGDCHLVQLAAPAG